MRKKERKKEASNLVFYDQSTSTVISRRKKRKIERKTEEEKKKQRKQTAKERCAVPSVPRADKAKTRIGTWSFRISPAYQKSNPEIASCQLHVEKQA